METNRHRSLHNRGRLAWLGLATVLVALTLFALLISVASHIAGNSVESASRLQDAYQRARYAIASEESLERKYRLEPGPGARADVRRAAADLVTALDDVQASGTVDDARLAMEVRQLHVTYLLAIDRMFAAVDADEPELALQIDDANVDPVFETIERRVGAAADQHGLAASSNLATLASTNAWIFAATPIVFILGIALLLFAWTALRQSERRLEAVALREIGEIRAAKQRAEAVAQISTRLRHLEGVETPALAGQAIADALLGLEGIDSPSILAFDDSGNAVVLGRGGGRVGPVEVGGMLPPSRSAYLLARARNGSWIEHRLPAAADGEYGARFAATGMVAMAYAPIGGEEGPIGLLAVGTSDAVHASQLAGHLPALDEFALSARILLEKPLAAQRDLARSHARLERIVADGAFRPVFQPIVDLATRQPVGYEALTRFEDGTRPDLVFAEARRCGLGIELETATLRAALEASDGLPDGLFLSLNVSPAFAMAGAQLSGILANRTRPVVIEVTEHDVIGDYDALRSALVALGAGVRLAVDDAGAGIANFTHLVELRPQFVKVDIGLVHGVNADLTRQALIVALLHFARATDCAVIAEGVETEAERAVLASLEVGLGQGYLFGHPAEAGTWSAPRSPRGSSRRPGGLHAIPAAM